ncbi:hypothetical protein EG68_02902 [Paragonimus skrjabini miyazakii]|uniref:Uncharacterized protein n=1 Tax=Paragonimus skrjabini miyazakii TaxID=59628 RepID=A0A8S9Z392_9TREM|nr:hypothetical protein EG68_02902 [Paragonimus skrjabini miyazakii]
MLRSAVDKILTQLPSWSSNEHKRNIPSMNTRKWFWAEKNTVHPDSMESSFDDEPLLKTDCQSFSTFHGNTSVISELPDVTKQNENETKSRFICRRSLPRQSGEFDRCERLKNHVFQIRSGSRNYTELKDDGLCTIVRSGELPIYGFNDAGTDITYISVSDHTKWSCPNSTKPTPTTNVSKPRTNLAKICKLSLLTSQPNLPNNSHKNEVVVQPKLPFTGITSHIQTEDNSPGRLKLMRSDIIDPQTTTVAYSAKPSTTETAWSELDIRKQLTISSGQQQISNNSYVTSSNQQGKHTVFESPVQLLPTKETPVNHRETCAHCDPSNDQRIGDAIPVIVTGYIADQSENNRPKNRTTVGRINDRMLKAPLRRHHWSFTLYEFDAQKLREDTDGIIRSVIAVVSASLKRTVLVRKLDPRRKRPRVCAHWLGSSHSQPHKEMENFGFQIYKPTEPNAQIYIEVDCHGCRSHSHVELDGRYLPKSMHSQNSAQTLRKADHRNLRNSGEKSKRRRFHQWEARQSYQKVYKSKTDCCTLNDTDMESTHHYSFRHTNSVVSLTNESVACHSSSSSLNLTCNMDRRANSVEKRCEFNCVSQSMPGLENSFEVCACHRHNISTLTESRCGYPNDDPVDWTALRTLHLCGASSQFRHARKIRQSQRMSVRESFLNNSRNYEIKPLKTVWFIFLSGVQAERTVNRKPNWKRIARPCWFKISGQPRLQIPTSDIIVAQQKTPEIIIRFDL